MGAGGSDVSPQLSLVGLPRGDPQLRRHDVRPRRADGIGLLALGRRQPARDRHRPARRCRRRQQQRISRRRNHFGQRRRPEALHRRRPAAGPRCAPLLHRRACGRASRSSNCRRGRQPGLPRLQPVHATRSPAPSSTAPTSRSSALRGRPPQVSGTQRVPDTPRDREAFTSARARWPSRRRRPATRSRPRAGGGRCRRECAWPTSRRRR